MKVLNLLLLAGMLSISACKKDSKQASPDPTPETPTGSIQLEFKNMVDTNALTFGTKYVNANGDTFTVSKFNYFVSNIVFIKTDNSGFAEPNSYHLVKHNSPASWVFTVSGVPTGNYKAVQFMLGVDSTRNVSGAQTGGLDLTTAGDMFWGWSSGYIFMKIDGTSPQSGSAQKTINFHIGGFEGANKTMRNFNFNFGTTTANVSIGTTPMLHFTTNLNEVFKSPVKLSFANLYNITDPGPTARTVADNYADMFSLKSVQN